MGKYMIHNIVYYDPDDNEHELYIKSGSYTIHDVIQKIQEHFQVTQEQAITDFIIEAVYVHTDCIGYDAYDPGDYTNYLYITRK